MLEIFSKALNRLSIKAQVISITVLSIIGISAITIGALYISSIVDVSTNYSISESEKATTFTVIDKFGFEMRQHEKNYLANFDDASIEKYKSAYSMIIQAAEKVSVNINYAADKDKLVTIMDGFSEHSKQFLYVVSMREKLNSYTEKLNNSLKNIDETISILKKEVFNPEQLSGVQVELLALRIVQKDFMLSGDISFLEAFKNGLKKLGLSIKEVFLSKKQKKALNLVIEDYKTRFHDWSEIKDNYNQNVNKLELIYAKFSSHILDLTNQYSDLSNSATIERIDTQERANFILVIVSIIIGLVIAFISLFVAINIAQKIKQLNTRMMSLADGETGNEIPNIGLKNELGDMAKSLLVFKENLIARITSEKEKKVFDDEEMRKAKYIGELIEDFKNGSSENITQVQDASVKMEEVSKILNKNSGDMQDQSKIVSSNVQNTSENVTTAASATEEMVASIREIAVQASNSVEIAKEAQTETKDTVIVISELSNSAKHIENVVKLIEEIAEQTNLLALNATIEAARAGEAGKGFAVVANEVKSLASQTAKATIEITERINAIQNDSEKATKSITLVAQIIEKLSDTSNQVANAVEEQSNVIDDIAANVTSASDLSTKSAVSMQKVDASIDETKNVSDDVYELANHLSGQVSILESDISKFLKDVKSA